MQRFLITLSGLLGEFRTFVVRGNVVDLAVGIVIGAAFQSVVTGFVTDLLTPVISIPAHTEFLKFTFKINGSEFLIGDFINRLISFVLLAAVIFFFVVRPINMLMALGRRFHSAPADQRDCPFCTSHISIRATRCPFCTAELEPVAPANLPSIPPPGRGSAVAEAGK